MMQQYKAIKAKHPDALLFYRMGDFFELFNDDALIAASLLNITLTKRRTAKDGDEGYPMCGVPFHAAEGYIATLVRAGYKVALCEQVESPEEAKRRDGAKALVRRDVVRVYTSGTLTEDSMLPPEENSYLAALYGDAQSAVLAWVDISTGECAMEITPVSVLSDTFNKRAPKELLLPAQTPETWAHDVTEPKNVLLSRDNRFFRKEACTEALCRAFKVHDVTALGLEDERAIRAAGAVILYLEETQVGALPALQRPRLLSSADHVMMDAATRNTLEISLTQRGEKTGSLLWAIDHTLTAPGARMLSQWVHAPLVNLEKIQARQEAIGRFLEEDRITTTLRDLLRQTADVARNVSRISLGRGGPRDLAQLRNTLLILPEMCAQLAPLHANSAVQGITKQLVGFEALAGELFMAIKEDDLPLLPRDGGFIKEGYCDDLDKHVDLATNGLHKIRALEEEERKLTGISSLKVKYNKVWGYFIEITNTHAGKAPSHYVHRQTTVNTQRFSTDALMQLERALATAESHAKEREMALFDGLCQKVHALATRLLKAAQALAALDVLTAGALLAAKQHYICPTLDGSRTFLIKEGRHPVIEKTVSQFIANDTDLSDGALWLVTGPNMAGKSTFLRQNALITLLAHIGYWVPAQQAHIGLVDRIFTRIGASDDLSKGQSTFMVEMSETAAIMNNATDKSLVVLDEIGRGTATHDGLAIAWACVEYLCNHIKARGLFATHYHELTQLSSTFNTLKNVHVQVKEWEDTITFLYHVGEGSAPRSYGIHVAQIAGMPPALTRRAEQILNRLEKHAGTAKNLSPVDLPLFGATPPAPRPPLKSALESHLEGINVDDLSPREALDLMYTLKTMAQKEAVA